MSAPRASETSSSNASPSIAADPARTVLLPGSPATYANRAVLREMGLRWDPAGHRWHGTTTVEAVKKLRERLGLEVRCFGSLDVQVPLPKGPAAPRPPDPIRAIAILTVPPRHPARRSHDGLQTNPSGSSHPRTFVPGTRTHAEARTVYRAEEDDGVAPSRFSERDITSGLPDDSREEDEKTANRALRDLRSRVKQARAIAANTPGLYDVLENDWRKAARFYARFGITENMLRRGVPAAESLLESLNGLGSIPG